MPLVVHVGAFMVISDTRHRPGPLRPLLVLVLVLDSHTVEHEVFVGSNSGVLIDQMCAAQGPHVDCVGQVDF